MKLVERDAKILDGMAYVKTRNYETLLEFLNSDMSVAEVVDYPQKSAEVCTASLRNSIKKFKFNSIGVTYRMDKVFLFKKNVLKND